MSRAHALVSHTATSASATALTAAAYAPHNPHSEGRTRHIHGAPQAHCMRHMYIHTHSDCIFRRRHVHAIIFSAHAPMHYTLPRAMCILRAAQSHKSTHYPAPQHRIRAARNCVPRLHIGMHYYDMCRSNICDRCTSSLLSVPAQTYPLGEVRARTCVDLVDCHN